MAKITRKAFSELAEIVLEGGARKATHFFSDKLVLKATYQGKRDRRSRQQTIVFTIGKPNYAERAEVKRLTAHKQRIAGHHLIHWPEGIKRYRQP